MRVFVFEHICGGGLSQTDLRPTLARKGGAMLAALVADFVHAGAEVTASLDRRVELPLPGARVEPVTPGSDFTTIFDGLAKAADAAMVVAPEFGRLLEGWARRLEQLGVPSLGCSTNGIALCGDKLALARHLGQAGLATPATTLGLPAGRSGDRPFPFVAKPRYGAGCEDTFICRSTNDLANLPRRDDWITQPLIPGRAASCAFIVQGTTIRPLRAGEQFIAGDGRLAYRGGRMPLPADLEGRAIELGTKALRLVPGLHGYVGVDLVLGVPGGTPGATGSLPASALNCGQPEGSLPDESRRHWQASCQWHPDNAADHVIEINPRPTVAFVGLRHLCTTSLAAAILDPTAPLAWHDRTLSYNAAGYMEWESPP